MTNIEKTGSGTLAQTLADPRNPRSDGKAAVDVERHLIWTYQAQAADRVVARFISRTTPAWYGSNLGAVIRHGMYGARIDGGGGVVGAVDLHPDAEAAHDAVQALGGEMAGLLVLHARMGSQPEWIAQEPRLIPKRRGGKLAMVYLDRDGRRPSHCLLELHPDPETVAASREVYALWWDGLAAVAKALAGRLKDFEVTGPAVSRTPWLDRRGKT